MSTRASAGTTDSPSSLRCARGWSAIRSWRSLSMSAIESRLLPYSGMIVEKQVVGYSLSLRWVEGKVEGEGVIVRSWVIEGCRQFNPLCSIDTASRIGQQKESRPCLIQSHSQTSHGLLLSQRPRCFSHGRRQRRVWLSRRLKIPLNIWISSKRSGTRR